jgi:hypothetical protein
MAITQQCTIHLNDLKWYWIKTAKVMKLKNRQRSSAGENTPQITFALGRHNTSHNGHSFTR